MGPLSGMKVVEFAGLGPAPFCAMLLSDLGADVIRVDRIIDPDAPAQLDDGATRWGGGVLGRGRRSIALNLKHPDAVLTAISLIADADVLIEGFRPGVMERLGLGPDRCHAANQRLVYGRVTGWGQDGPYSQMAGHDLNFIAIAGVLAAVGSTDGPPVPPLNLIGDFAAGGMFLAVGILAARAHALTSGVGQVVDTSMVDGSAYLMAMMFELLGRGAWVESRGSNPNDGGAHFYGVYETSDGKYVSIAAMEPQFYDRLLVVFGLDPATLPDQWDPAGWPALRAQFADIFRSRSRDAWCTILEGTDTCFAPVLTMSEALVHPHNLHRGTFTTVDGRSAPSPAPKFSVTPGSVGRAKAFPGEHTDEVLLGLGVPDQAVKKLRDSGAVG